MNSRLQIEALVASLVLATAACVRPLLPPSDLVASLRVRVTLEGNEGVNLRTFVGRNVRVAAWPTLPSTWMPLALSEADIAGFAAFSTERLGQSWVLALESSKFGPIFKALPVSYRQAGSAGTTIVNRLGHAVAAFPCEWGVGFFVKGVGDHPSSPVVLRRWQNHAPSQTISVDPARHTLTLTPVLRFSIRDVKGLRSRKATFLLGVRATSGMKPFLLLGLMKLPDGSFTAASFVSNGEEQGWGGFIHTPGETTEVSFYALDDPPAVHSACRPMMSGSRGLNLPIRPRSSH